MIEKQQELNDSIFVSISYDSDLLLLEPFTQFIETIQKQIQDYPITLEVRSKSGSISLLDNIVANDKFLLNYSLSPDMIADRYESKSASLDKRLKTINDALARGFRVGVAFDPLLYIDDFDDVYNEFFDKVFSIIEHKNIDRFILGTFRMNTGQLKKIRKEAYSDIIHYPYESINQVSTYSLDINKYIKDFVENKLSFIDKDKMKYL
jgi:spore photoproduct lyase